MTRKFVAGAGLLALTAAAAPANAQQGDWQYDASLYMYMAETTNRITTPVRTIESTLSFKDALKNLDGTFMGSFGASNGRWSFLLDYMYTDLSFSNPTPGPIFTGINTSLTLKVLNGYAAYRVYDDPSVQLDLAAGFRWFDVSSALTLVPVPPGGTNATSDDWVDPVIGFRARMQFSDRWTGTAFFDYGGFQSGEETWQALLTADFAINDNWLVRGGYRYLTVDHRTGANTLSITQSGPILGVTYRF